MLGVARFGPWIALVCAWLLVGACGNDRARSSCTVGTTVPCACPGGTWGMRSCNADGTLTSCACGGGGVDGGVPVQPPDASGTDAAIELVITSLRFDSVDSVFDPMIMPGFDLDRRVSDESDVNSCEHRDFTSPSPTSQPGVDNQLGAMLTVFGPSFDVAGTIADSIANGSLILLVRVSGVGSRDEDPSVQIELFSGSYVGGTPLLFDGRLAPGQSFHADRAIGGGSGSIVAGSVRGVGLTLDLDLGLGSTGALSLPMTGVEARLDLTSDQHVGMLGGALEVEDLVTALVTLAPDSIDEPTARAITTGQADLDHDAASDECRQISAGFELEATSAIIAM